MPMSPNEKTDVDGYHCRGDWLSACVRYWPFRGVGTCASMLKLVLFTTVFTTDPP